METTATRVARILEKGLGADAVTPDARLISDLGCDSLDLISLIMETEEEFNIDITDTEAEPFVRDDGEVGKTVQDWTAFVEAKLAEKAPA